MLAKRLMEKSIWHTLFFSKFPCSSVGRAPDLIGRSDVQVIPRERNLLIIACYAFFFRACKLSGQKQQTFNLWTMSSEVRILPCPRQAFSYYGEGFLKFNIFFPFFKKLFGGKQIPDIVFGNFKKSFFGKKLANLVAGDAT